LELTIQKDKHLPIALWQCVQKREKDPLAISLTVRNATQGHCGWLQVTAAVFKAIQLLKKNRRRRASRFHLRIPDDAILLELLHGIDAAAGLVEEDREHCCPAQAMHGPYGEEAEVLIQTLRTCRNDGQNFDGAMIAEALVLPALLELHCQVRRAEVDHGEP
jgi:hypothetical protein